MNKYLICLANKEMQRLHSLAIAVKYESGYYSNQSDHKPDEGTREWARKQLEYFHEALLTPVIFQETPAKK